MRILGQELDVAGQINSPATETTAGVVRIINSIDSTSTKDAATPNSVKMAYDRANHDHSHLISGNNSIRIDQPNDASGLEKMNNVSINTWWGFSVCPAIEGFDVPKDIPAFSVDARTGNIHAKGKITAFDGRHSISQSGFYSLCKREHTTDKNYYHIAMQNPGNNNAGSYDFLYVRRGVTNNTSDSSLWEYIWNVNGVTGIMHISNQICDYRLPESNQQLMNVVSNTIYVGNANTPLKLESSINPQVNINGTNVTLYHTNNKPTPANIGALASTGGALSGSLTLSSGNIVVNNGYVKCSASLQSGANLRLGGDKNIECSIHTVGYDGAAHNVYSKVLESKVEHNYFGLASQTFDSVTYLRGGNVRLYANSGGVFLGKSASTAVTSDENLKTNMSPILGTKYEEFFKNLVPLTYKYKGKDYKRIHLGFGARATEQALYDAGLHTQDFAGIVIERDVNIPDEEAMDDRTFKHYDEVYSLRYEEFIALNTMMIQRLMKTNEEKDETIRNLSERLESLEKKTG